MSWKNMRSNVTITGEARDILSHGGRKDNCKCPGYGSCQHTANFLIGTMVAKGYTLDRVRENMLFSGHKGAEWITCQEDPIAAFLDAWEYCTRNDTPAEDEPTEDDQRATVLFIIESRPGIGTTDIRKRSGMRNATAADALAWLVEEGYVRRDESAKGRKVPHYRTGKVYEPLDAPRVREHFLLWGVGPNSWDYRTLGWVLGQERLMAGFSQRLARHMADTAKPVTRDTWQQAYGLTDAVIERIEAKATEQTA